MRTPAKAPRHQRKHHHLRLPKPWSIRTQLMLFLSTICLGLLGLVWVLSSHLLQPYYNTIIRENLEAQVSGLVTLMDNMAEDGVLISNRTEDTLVINAAFQTAFHNAVAEDKINLDNLCINVADTSLSYVMYSEGLTPCLMHGGAVTLFAGEELTPYSRDNETTIALRKACFEKGEIYVILSSGEWQQMLVGQTTRNGEYAVLISANLSQVVDAAIVLETLAPSVGFIVLLVALIAAWQFSRWFTKPISNLTKASHTMAKGDYSVQIYTHRHDEFGQLTDEFNKMAKEVHRTARLQSELLANVSHDLRTPLTLIRGYAETIRDITGENPEKRTDNLNIIIDETDRLTALVNSILELAKVSTGVEKYAPCTIELAPFFAEIFSRYQGLCVQNGWTFLLDVPTKPLFIYADRDMIERALDNLLGNAMAHLGRDNTFILRAHQTKHHLCRIEIEDHGKGVSPEEREALFERYYRSRHNTGKQGTGLGLSIARAIFKQHGFALGVDSTPNECTTFWFDAPLETPTKRKELR